MRQREHQAVYFRQYSHHNFFVRRILIHLTFSEPQVGHLALGGRFVTFPSRNVGIASSQANRWTLQW